MATRTEQLHSALLTASAFDRGHINDLYYFTMNLAGYSGTLQDMKVAFARDRGIGVEAVDQYIIDNGII